MVSYLLRGYLGLVLMVVAGVQKKEEETCMSLSCGRALSEGGRAHPEGMDSERHEQRGPLVYLFFRNWQHYYLYYKEEMEASNAVPLVLGIGLLPSSSVYFLTSSDLRQELGMFPNKL